MGEAVRGILFDKDGTLFDFRATWGRWARGFLEELVPDTAVRARFAARLGVDLERSDFAPDSPIIAGSPHDIAEVVADVVDELSSEFDRDGFIAKFNASAAAAPVVAPVPLEPLIVDFRARGLVLGVATNDSELAARAHLEQAGILEDFDFVVGFDSGHGAKPAPGMQNAFCRAFDLEPAQVLMVGDSTHDLHAGRAAGMRAIAVLTGIATAADLAPHADAVLPHVGHLPAWIDQQEG